ncbi:MAG TPA: hypothetical protein VEJ20_04240 [Candidatus Eremiobacteraceae bacterium]|nr:hypothetical protein [Candidatus Eremiobacteraceae bacterium]
MQPRASTFRLMVVPASIAVVVAVVGGSTRGVAGLPFPLPGGNIQGIAVQAALSEFGKAIGMQVPITLSTSDAYPTADLPGAPFSSSAVEPNITRALRSSTDGTIELPPGDYQFTVDVFCMKATAHSPDAHRYLVAPLQGSAADIFRALDSRAPFYSVPHSLQQMLSWDIQGGLSYDEMPSPIRAVVDQVIPDYRSRLTSDAFDNIQNKFNQISSTVPGMPSFDGALGQMGTVGQAVLQMEALHQQMLEPPPTYQQLISGLVPYSPPVPGGSQVTPWSRYSDRVYVRFTTSGNFSTPGSYQVRVLPEGLVSATSLVGLGSPNSAAAVPFTNVVNNPGDSGVQPLTQSPQGGPNPPETPQPSPSPTQTASITSQTFAKVPADRSRRTIGVGEQVKLTFSGEDAHWSLSGGSGEVTPTGKTSIFTASITPATETIEAVDTKTGATAQITFDVIAPNGLAFQRIPSTTIHHHKGWPDIGFEAKVYLLPDNVSFDNIGVREQDSAYVATGYYSWMNGVTHNPAKTPEVTTSLVPGKGWLLANEDDVWSGREDYPFNPGYENITIPWEYDAAADGDAGPFHVFASVLQSCELDKDGKTITARKGSGAGEAFLQLLISSPDYK